MDLNDIPVKGPVESIPEEVSLEPKEPVKQKNYIAPKVKLSENIKAFDEKIKVHTQNPYDYNTISLNQEKAEVPASKSAEEMITDPTYNMVGKFLGVDTIHDWNSLYDKVFTIVEWAKGNTQTEDLDTMIRWIGDQQRSLPNIGAKNIDNLYLYARLYLNKK